MYELEQNDVEQEQERRLSQRVRVRLLIAFPLLIVLVVVISAGILYQLVELQVGSIPPTTAVGKAMEAHLGELARRWILTMIGFVVGGAIVGFAVAYSITSPIRHLVGVSQRLAKGNLSERSNLRRADDFGILGHSFDSMVDSLNRFIEQRNRFILESFSGGLLALDVHGTITAMNSAAEELLGVKAEQATGKPFEEVLAGPALELLRHTIRKAFWGEEKVRTQRLLLKHEEGESKPILVQTSHMKESDGSLFGIIVNLRDLEQWERFHREMARTDQLAALGTFAAGLAHELRNPLGAIRGLAQLLGEEPTLPERCREYTRVIVRECERLDILVREIHDFSQPPAQPDTMVRLDEVVQQALQLARGRLVSGALGEITFVEELDELPPTRANEQRLVQAFVNVITNAIEAAAPGGVVRLRTRFFPKERLALRVEIENTGPALDPAIREKIFEPFFTTKEHGTGLGLAITHQIITSHGGRIDFENLHDGVRAIIELPLITVSNEGGVSSAAATDSNGQRDLRGGDTRR